MRSKKVAGAAASRLMRRRDVKAARAILHWEDRATEWSGKADRVKVSLPLYRSGSLVGSALVTANSSWWTFGGDHPEDLLDTPFESYAASLVGKANPKSDSFRALDRRAMPPFSSRPQVCALANSDVPLLNCSRRHRLCCPPQSLLLESLGVISVFVYVAN